MRRRTNAGVAFCHLLPVRLHVGDQFRKGRDRQGFLAHEHHGQFGDHADRLEIGDRVVAQVAIERGVGSVPEMHH